MARRPDRADRRRHGIAWAFTRSPFILAISALDVDEMSGGRFRLGLGAGVKRLNETWHGVEYGRPAPHLRETIEAVRLIMAKAHAGEPIRYQGEYHDIDIKGWCDRSGRLESGCRSTPRPSARGWRGWRGT